MLLNNFSFANWRYFTDAVLLTSSSISIFSISVFYVLEGGMFFLLSPEEGKGVFYGYWGAWECNIFCNDNYALMQVLQQDVGHQIGVTHFLHTPFPHKILTFTLE